jgi:predicted RNase H-like HicB family nuclease
LPTDGHYYYDATSDADWIAEVCSWQGTANGGKSVEVARRHNIHL